MTPITPLDATLTDEHRVLPRFGRNRPPTTPLESTLTRYASVTPLDATLTKTRGVGGLKLTGQSRHHLTALSPFPLLALHPLPPIPPLLPNPPLPMLKEHP